MKTWTNQTNSVHKVDDNNLWPRTTYMLPDELTWPIWENGMTESEISEQYKVDRHSIRNARLRGWKSGWTGIKR